MRLKRKYIWWAALSIWGVASFFGVSWLPKTWGELMNIFVDIDRAIINNAEYPGLFALFLGLLLGTVIMPEAWPYIRRYLLRRAQREFESDFDDPINQDARDDFTVLLDRAYTNYGIGDKPKLADLLDGIEFPQDFPPMIGSIRNYAYNIDWPNAVSQDFWNFSLCLMSDVHSGNFGGLLKSKEEVDTFRRSRRIAAKFWNKWAIELMLGTITYNEARKQIIQNRRAITALAVAELAHSNVVSLGDGPGKTGLFELAIRPARLGPTPLWKRIFGKGK